jgi:hypothetical protein
MFPSVLQSLSEKSTKENSQLLRIIQALDKSPAVSYVLTSDRRFLYYNQAWDVFARSNAAPELEGGTVIGRDLFDVIPSPLTKVYADAFESGWRNIEILP